MPATKLTYKKDPLEDRRDVVKAFDRPFKGASVPSNPFKSGKPRTEIDPTYDPGFTGTQRQ